MPTSGGFDETSRLVPSHVHALACSLIEKQFDTVTAMVLEANTCTKISFDDAHHVGMRALPEGKCVGVSTDVWLVALREPAESHRR